MQKSANENCKTKGDAADEHEKNECSKTGGMYE